VAVAQEGAYVTFLSELSDALWELAQRDAEAARIRLESTQYLKSLRAAIRSIDGLAVRDPFNKQADERRYYDNVIAETTTDVDQELLPRLRLLEQSLRDSSDSPSLADRPLSSLAQVIAPDAAHLPADQARAYWSNSRRLTHLVTEHGDTPVVLLVDQFEEVFTRGDDSNLPESETRLFLENLLELVRTPGPRHTLIVAIRSDYESYVQRYPELRAWRNSRARYFVHELSTSWSAF
jgi:hypothetical protein